MNSRTIPLILAVAVMIIASGTAVAAVTGSPDLSVTFADNTVSPGEETTLDVVIANSGDLDSGSASNPSLNSEVTTARSLRVNLNSGDSPITVSTNRQQTGDLATGTPRTVSFDISVAEDAEPGTYSVPVELDYDYYDYISESVGVRDESSVSRTVNVNLRVSDDATFDVVDVDSNARVGSTGGVALTVQNTGSTAANDAAITLASQNGEFTVGGGEQSSRFVETWASGENRTFEYRVGASGDAEPEPYNFDLSVSFDDADGVREESVGTTVGVAPAPEQTFSVVNTSSAVAVSNTGEYELTLRNDGPVTVNDSTVTVTSQSSDITFGEATSTSQFVGQWAPGEVRTITVDATASSGAGVRSYALTAAVGYEDPEGDSGTDSDLSIGLEPAPEQEFSLSNVSGTLRAGEDGTLEATLVNDGPRTVENAVVDWESDHSNLSPQETEYAVGTLEPGESTTVSFGVDASDSAREGPRQFDFTVGYEDDNGDQQTSSTLSIQSDVAASEDEFDLEPANATVSAGGSGNIEVTITNTRDMVLRDISAQMFADSPISADDDEAFVAELGPGESTTLTFSISAEGGALDKTYPVSVDFQYEEPDGDTPVSDTYQVPVTVTTGGNGGGGLPLLGIGAGLVVIVLGVGGYFRFR